MTVPDSTEVAGPPVLSRDPAHLPEGLTRGADIPDDLDPFADGILMDHQKEWLEDQSDLKLAEKGRRTGITFAEALDDTLIAASSRSAGGDNVFYIGDTKDKGREFIGYVAHFAKVVAGELHQVEEFLFKDERPDGTSKDISAFRITFASGFRVEALSSNPANIRGLQGIVVIDEAAYHRDVREVIDAVNALLIWGGKVRVISTHNGVLNAFNELIRESRAGKNPFKIHFMPFGKAVENGLFKRVCKMKGKVWSQQAQDEWEALIRGSYGPRTAAMRQELDAIPAEAEGSALSRIQIEKRMEKGIPFRRWVQNDDFRNVELRNIPFDQQRDILFYVCDRIPRFSKGAMDKGGNGAYLAEKAVQRYGEKIIEVSFSQEWYRQEMPPYIEAFGDGTIVLCEHADVLQDHQALQYVDGVIRIPRDFRFKGSDGFDRHGDSAVAGALAFFASRQDVEEFGYEGTDTADRWRSGPATGDDDDEVVGRFGKGAW